MMYGFSNLVLLFEKILPDFYDWNIGDLGEPCDLSSLANIYKSVAFASPLLEEVSETSRVDFVLTQQWLQTRLWRFYMDRKDFCQAQNNSDLPKLLPAIAGKSVMACLSSVAQKSTDAHGIGAVCYSASPFPALLSTANFLVVYQIFRELTQSYNSRHIKLIAQKKGTKTIRHWGMHIPTHTIPIP
jgi:hypothetical protein